jgi:diguanylate cyclase (GGDEF)-like protein
VIKGLKSLFFSLTAFSLVYYAVVKSQTYWLQKIVIIEQLLFVFLVVIIVFASYFNRSRLAFLSMLWLLYYTNLSFTSPWSSWLAVHGDWLILFGCFCLMLLSMIKDRGVVSIHGFYRLVFIAVAGGVAFLWLSTNDVIITSLQSHTNIDSFKKYITVELPVFLSVVIALWRTVKRADLVTSAVFISLIVWIAHYYQQTTLPISLLLMLLSVHYITVIVIDAYFLAYRDDLTGLPSRRALNQLALSLGRKYTVAMLDIDHFKKFNDTYGHDIGDQVLKLVAAKIGNVKGGGKAFRYGGEEFTIVFPSKTIEQALPELEIVRQAIEDYKIVIRHPQRKTKQERSHKKGGKNTDFKTVNVTISIGAAIRSDKQGFEQALKCSDQALYKAKKTGRNKVSY